MGERRRHVQQPEFDTSLPPQQCVDCGQPHSRGRDDPFRDASKPRWRCAQCWRHQWKAEREESKKKAELIKGFLQMDDGWKTLATLYGHRGTDLGCREPSTNFQLKQQGGRPALRAYGAARQLLEESRSIFLNNLTNSVVSVLIAQQFFAKASEEAGGVLRRAHLRLWVKGMLCADAYAGLDREAELCEILARALRTEPELERRAGPGLERALRAQQGQKQAATQEPESWCDAVDAGSCKEGHDDSEGEMSNESASEADADSPQSLVSDHIDDNIDVEDVVDADEEVPFDVFWSAVDSLSIKSLLRVDAVRHEVPTSEEPPLQPLPTVCDATSAASCSLWEEADLPDRVPKRNASRRCWEDAYATGRSCIWVLPEADQDVIRVLRERWFEAKGICLELGCGLGYDSLAFAEAGFDAVVGVDVSETAIAAASAMARSKGVEDRARFLCVDAYELSTPRQPVALLWDNTLYQNAQRCDRYGPRHTLSSARYKSLLLRLTAPGTLVLLNVMSSELTEGHSKLSDRGFHLPLTSAMKTIMEFVEHFEFIFVRNGVYDMNSLFIDEASAIGYRKPAILGGLPSWCFLMRRRAEPKPCVAKLPTEEAYVVATKLWAEDGFRKAAEPRFLRRMVEEEWGEDWGDGPQSALMIDNGEAGQDYSSNQALAESFSEQEGALRDALGDLVLTQGQLQGVAPPEAIAMEPSFEVCDLETFEAVPCPSLRKEDAQVWDIVD